MHAILYTSTMINELPPRGLS